MKLVKGVRCLTSSRQRQTADSVYPFNVGIEVASPGVSWPRLLFLFALRIQPESLRCDVGGFLVECIDIPIGLQNC